MRKREEDGEGGRRENEGGREMGVYGLTDRLMERWVSGLA